MTPGLSLLVIVLTATQTASAGQGTTMTREAAQLADSVQRIAGRVEAIRDLKFRATPAAARVPQDVLDVAAELRAFSALAPERLAARGRGWTDLGLGVPTTPSTIVRMLAADLGGMSYDPTAHRILLANETLTSADFETEAVDAGSTDGNLLAMTGVRPDEPAIGHVLIHLQQRERTGADHLIGSTDELLARAAWAEGEANLVAIRYLFGGMGLADSVTDVVANPGEFLDGKLVPPEYGSQTGAVADFLDFVYAEGYAQAINRYKAGGWAAIDRAMKSEWSTRQVLHPGRTAIPAGFPEAVPPAEGLTLRDEDTLGEQAMIVLISRLTGKDNLALQVGDGWAGDRLYRWEATDGGEGGVTELWTRWDSDEDVEDYLYGLKRGLPARFPGGTLSAAATGAGTQRLETAEYVVQVARDGLEVRLAVASGRFAAGFRGPDDEPSTNGGGDAGN